MPITINHATRIIYVPQDFLTPLGGASYQLDINDLRLALKDLEDDADGMHLPDATRHNGEVTLAGTTFARSVEFVNGYRIEFEDGAYSINLVGGNNNVADVMVVNQVSLRSNNSAGLIVNYVAGTDPDSLADAVMNRAYEGGLTLQDMTRLFASMLFGKVTGAASDTVRFRDLADAKDRVVISVDVDGNRSAVTLDPD